MHTPALLPTMQVKKACAATHMFKSSGTCVNIRVARSGQTQQQIADNIHAVLCQAVEHIPKKWANLQVRHMLASLQPVRPIGNLYGVFYMLISKCCKAHLCTRIE